MRASNYLESFRITTPLSKVPQPFRNIYLHNLDVGYSVITVIMDILPKSNISLFKSDSCT